MKDQVRTKQELLEENLSLKQRIKDLEILESELKQAVETLRESEELFRQSQVIAGLGSYVGDLTAGTWKSSAMLDQLFGIDETFQRTIEAWSELVHPDDRKMMTDYFEKEVIGQKQEFNKEYRLLPKNDGSAYWVHGMGKLEYDTQGQPIKMYGTIQDISSRKKAEMSLQQSENLFRTLFVHSPDPVWIIENNHFVECNQAAADMLAYPDKELLLNTHPSELSPEFQPDGELSYIKAERMLSIVLEKGLNRFEWVHTRFDKSDFFAEVTLSAITLHERPVIYCTWRDISEKKQLEIEREKFEQQQIQIQRIESLGILAGGIAHDFNNLLAGIFGYIQIALSSTADPMMIECLNSSMRSMDRAKSLTQQLLTFSKGGAPQVKTQELGPIIRANALFALSGSEVACDLDIDDDLLQADIDENQLGQVLGNIVINAKQAMPEDGKVIISAKNVVFCENENSHLNAGKYIKISISDTGIGIPSEDLEKIFDPFFTTKNNGQGLGLSTSFSIVRQHQGSIEVESKIGKGSTFHILLPAACMERAQSESQQTTISHSGKGRILIMDDEADIRNIMSVFLKKMGYSVITVKNGEEALKFCADPEKTRVIIDGAFFDLTIPDGMGGKDTIAEFRKLYPDIPIFVSSGYSDDPIMADPTKYGFTDSIAKPFRFDDIAQLLDRYAKK